MDRKHNWLLYESNYNSILSVFLSAVCFAPPLPGLPHGNHVFGPDIFQLPLRINQNILDITGMLFHFGKGIRNWYIFSRPRANLLPPVSQVRYISKFVNSCGISQKLTIWKKKSVRLNKKDQKGILMLAKNRGLKV